MKEGCKLKDHRDTRTVIEPIARCITALIIPNIKLKKT